MIIIKRYSDIKGIPVAAKQYLQQYFSFLHQQYGNGSSLGAFQLGAIGELVYIEEATELNDLAIFGYTGN